MIGVNQYPYKSLTEKFWGNIILDKNNCFLWIGRITNKGYGQLYWKKKHYYAHQFAYIYLRGPIEKGLELDHLCRVRNCANPYHVEPVTHKVNMSRGAHALKTHCPKGHEYTDENTYLYDNRRTCKTCKHPKKINGSSFTIK